MSVLGRLAPAPVGRQGPPARAAAFDSCRSLRSRARVPPIDYGDGLHFDRSRTCMYECSRVAANPHELNPANTSTKLAHHPKNRYLTRAAQPHQDPGHEDVTKSYRHASCEVNVVTATTVRSSRTAAIQDPGPASDANVILPHLAG
jgi:hypothetical protein